MRQRNMQQNLPHKGRSRIPKVRGELSDEVTPVGFSEPGMLQVTMHSNHATSDYRRGRGGGYDGTDGRNEGSDARMISGGCDYAGI